MAIEWALPSVGGVVKENGDQLDKSTSTTRIASTAT